MNLKLDGISTSEHIDSSGELLIIENHDISDLLEGRGVLNFEHSNKAEDIVGAVIYAKKIMKKADCENERQRHYWDFSQKPFVYIIGELFEDEEHPGAMAVAAMVRYYDKKGEKMLVGFSIEGATLERNDYILQESVGRRVAITLRSCNKMAIAGLLDDPKTKSVSKSIKKMSKSVADSMLRIDSCIIDDILLPNDPILELHKAMENLNKTLTAGNYNVAPSQLTGGSALQVEHISGFNKNRVKAAVRDWDRKRPLRETIKAALPEVSDKYIDHFTDLAEAMSLKKAMTSTKLTRIGSNHSPNSHQGDEQKKLLEGLYFDKRKGPNSFDPGHAWTSNDLYKLKNDAGQSVLVKPPNGDRAERSTRYYELARDIFGLGKYVPATNYFQHKDLPTPEGHGSHSAMEIIAGAQTPYVMGGKEVGEAIRKTNSDGSLHKLMMMDHILGNRDRHSGNSIVHPKGYIMGIDNDSAFSNPSLSAELPWYAEPKDKLHPKAAQWVKSLNPKSLVGKMMDQGHSPETIKRSVAALRAYQQNADSQTPILGLHALATKAVSDYDKSQLGKKKIA